MQPAADFATFRVDRPDLGFCDWLRHRSRPLWEAMVGHRFTRDMGTDRLPRAAFVRYLRYEHAFVRTAVRIFGHALIAAPTTEDRVHIVGILSGLVIEQEAAPSESASAASGRQVAGSGSASNPSAANCRAK